MCVADGKDSCAEKVIALDLLTFEAYFVIGLGKIGFRVCDAAHRYTGVHDDGSVDNMDLAATGEIGCLPAVERLAVEERLPSRLVLRGRIGGHSNNSHH